MSPAVNPEAPWVPREDLSSAVVGGRGGPGEDWSTLTVGARGPGVREGDTVGARGPGEGGSSTGTFSGSPAVASEETKDNLSSVLGAGGCPGEGGGEG